MKPYCLFMEDGTRFPADTNDLFSKLKQNEIITIERFGECKIMTYETVQIDSIFKNEDGVMTIEYKRE